MRKLWRIDGKTSSRLLLVLATSVCASSAIAQEPRVAKTAVVLGQSMFPPPSTAEKSDIGPVQVRTHGGAIVRIEQLPAKVRARLLEFRTRVVPDLEVDACDPRELVGLIVREPDPPEAVRLNRRQGAGAPTNVPAWVATLSFGGTTIEGAVTNVSFLDLSLVLAEKLDCEFGITTNGDAIFSQRNNPANGMYHVERVRPKK